MSTVANAYLETQVMTASPHRLHLMVVDAAIRFARQGEAALKVKDYETAFHALDRDIPYLRLAFGWIEKEDIPDGVRALAECVREASPAVVR